MGDSASSEAGEGNEVIAVEEITDDGTFDKGILHSADLEREAVVDVARPTTGPRAPVATMDGASRILVRLEKFGDMSQEWMRVEATNINTGDVFLDRKKGDFVSLDVIPGIYQVTARIGDAPNRVRQASHSVVRLQSSQQDYASQKVRVLEGKISEVVFQPLPSGSVFGTVRRGQELMEGVHVILQAEESVIATTDASGHFRFDGVGVGYQQVRLGRPWIGVSAQTKVEESGEHRVDLEMPASGFQILVRHEELDAVLSGARVQIKFHPQRDLEEGPREGMAQGATAVEALFLPTGPDGLTPELMTGPGQVEYTVYGPQNYGLAGESGSFMVEQSGTRKHVVGLRGGTEVIVTREGGESGRMTVAYFVREDGVELGCGGIQRLDDNTGYRVWGVPRAAGHLYLTRTRSKRMWIAEVPASYERQEVTAEEVTLVPVHVRSARYKDGRSDYAVTLLAAHRSNGSAFPIGPVMSQPFGLRSTSRKGMALRPAEVTSLPPGSYTLYFQGRDQKVQAVPVAIGQNADKVVLDLVFEA